MSSQPDGPRILVVIPARGGSKAVPRKNLRRLGGRPLIAYSIEMARASRFAPDVWVSSDDDEILAVAEGLGATPYRRDPALAGDEVTLDSVVHDTYQAARRQGAEYDVVATVQPTSPLLRTASFDRAIARMVDDEAIDTIISAVEDTHLAWTRTGDRFEPLYEERVNRQYLPPTFRETGGFLISRSSVVTPSTRIGREISLELLQGGESIDIDTPQDFSLCEWYLGRRHVVFVVVGSPETGLGHVYNALTIAAELVRYDLTFLVPSGNELATEMLAAHNYTVAQQESDDLLADIEQLGPDVVINDILDTDPEYVQRLKRLGVTVVNFEDQGDGARDADLVVNAIYPERQLLPNHYFGHRYFCARAEFLVTGPTTIRDRVSRVLLTFGGTDPSRLTLKVLRAIHPLCLERGIDIDVILGQGYQGEHPPPLEGVEVVRSVSRMSEHIRRADLVFTSAGRTVFEVACIGTPAIVMAQNKRELTHFFASEEHGFLNLGLGGDIDEADILRTFADLIGNPAARRYMHELMQQNDLRSGTDRVVALLDRAIMSR